MLFWHIQEAVIKMIITKNVQYISQIHLNRWDIFELKNVYKCHESFNENHIYLQKDEFFCSYKNKSKVKYEEKK